LFNDPVTFSEGWNFGPYDNDVKPVDWILDHMIELWPGASWILNENENPHEATLLNLDISKASGLLGWTPTWDLPMTLGNIIRWHKLWLGSADMRKVCITEIDNFTKDMN
jgi:CDP-glucose 4,6-dehydratase